MSPVYVLFGLAMVMILGAVFLYSSNEDNDYKKFVNGNQDLKGDLNSLKNEFQNFRSIHVQRLDALVKRIDDLEVKPTPHQETLNLKMTSPLQVQIIKRPIPTAPKGLGKDSLIKRAGIKK